jgi:hypothetical protein
MKCRGPTSPALNTKLTMKTSIVDEVPVLFDVRSLGMPHAKNSSVLLSEAPLTEWAAQ